MNVSRQWKRTAGGWLVFELGVLIVTTLYCSTGDWTFGFSWHVNWSVSSVSICETCTVSQYINFPPYLQCHRWLLYVLFVVQPHSGPTLWKFHHIATKTVLMRGFWTQREGLESFYTWPRHVRMTLSLTNKHCQTTHAVSQNARQTVHQQSRFERNVHKLRSI